MISKKMENMVANSSAIRACNVRRGQSFGKVIRAGECIRF